MQNGTTPLNILNKYLQDLVVVPDRVTSPRTHAYRGQDKDWPLASAAQRRVHGDGDMECPPKARGALVEYVRTLISDYRTRGFDQQPGRPMSDLEVLSTLQHFGAATPLLDFTRNPLIALWFACRNTTNHGDDGVVYRADITYARHPPLNGTAALVEILDSFRPPFDLIEWQPPSDYNAGARAIAQQSLHLLIGQELGKAESNRSLSAPITINCQDKEPLLSILREMGITDKAMFPDLHGFASANTADQQMIDPPTIELLEKANEAYAQDDHDAATDLYLRYLKIEPTDTRALLALTNVCVDLNDLHRAREILDSNECQIVKSGQDDPLGTHLLAMYYFNRGNVKAAIHDHVGAIQDYTVSISDATFHSKHGARYARGNSYFATASWHEALEDFESCGDHSDAIYNAGNTLLMLGRFADAVERYGQAIRLLQVDSRMPNLHRNLLVARQLCTRIGEDSEIDAQVLDSSVIGIVRTDVPNGQDQRHFPIAGNVGNQGNRGVPPLLGGRSVLGRGTKGFDGMPGGLILLL